MSGDHFGAQKEISARRSAESKQRVQEDITPAYVQRLHDVEAALAQEREVREKAEAENVRLILLKAVANYYSGVVDAENARLLARISRLRRAGKAVQAERYILAEKLFGIESCVDGQTNCCEKYHTPAKEQCFRCMIVGMRVVREKGETA